VITDEIDSYILEIDNELNRLDKIFSDGHTLTQMLCRPEMKYKDLPGAKNYLMKYSANRDSCKISGLY